MISVSCPSAHRPPLTVSTGIFSQAAHWLCYSVLCKKQPQTLLEMRAAGACQSPPRTPGVCQDPVRTPVGPPQQLGTSFACSLFLGPSGFDCIQSSSGSGIPAGRPLVARWCLHGSLILLPGGSHSLPEEEKQRVTQDLEASGSAPPS